MATILIDYENVWNAGGLKGVEYLRPDDTLVIFYSQACRKIRAEYMEMIEKSGCELRSCKLVKVGKNGLDFYIASECGILSQNGEKQIAIISRDKGFGAIPDFFSVSPGNEDVCIVTATNVEHGLVALNAADDKERRRMLSDKMNTLDLETELKRLKEQKAREDMVREALLGTAYEEREKEVIEYEKISRDYVPKQLYNGALHFFGRKDGTEIYRLLKRKVFNL